VLPFILFVHGGVFHMGRRTHLICEKGGGFCRGADRHVGLRGDAGGQEGYGAGRLKTMKDRRCQGHANTFYD